jgi:S1-C subfamily serine protease
MRTVVSVAWVLAAACGGAVQHQPGPKAAPAPEAPAAGAARAEESGAPVVAEQGPEVGAGAEGGQSAELGENAAVRASAGGQGAAVPAPVAAGKGKAKGKLAPPAPPRLEAGEISRTALLAVLSEGVGRFLQRVRAEAHVVRGRFVGWRIVSLLPPAGAEGNGVRAGDTVMRVNGQSIERPEQFKNVWDSLATESELVLLVERQGQPAQLHYRIIGSR